MNLTAGDRLSTLRGMDSNRSTDTAAPVPRVGQDLEKSLLIMFRPH